MSDTAYLELQEAARARYARRLELAMTEHLVGARIIPRNQEEIDSWPVDKLKAVNRYIETGVVSKEAPLW